MQVPIPTQPITTQLSRVVVGNPTSAQHGRDWILGLAHLIGYNITPVTSQTLAALSSVNRTIYVAYKKRPGINLLRVSIEPQIGSAALARGTLTVTAVDSSGGAVTTHWLSGSTVMDGTEPLSLPNVALRDYGQVIAWLDISAMTDGSYYDIKFAWADVASSQGLCVINVCEQPLGSSDPTAASSEPGADLTWTRARQKIVDGSSSGTKGMQRILGQMEVARYQCPRQALQINVPDESATPFAWDVITTSTGTAVPFLMGSNPTFRIRPRALYGTTVANNYILRVRYKNSDNTFTTTFRVDVKKVGGSVVHNDYTLKNETAFTSRTQDNSNVDMAFTVPCDGTNQEALISFAAWNGSAAKHTYISQIALIENET